MDRRRCPLLLVAFVVLGACSGGPAETTGSDATPAATAAPDRAAPVTAAPAEPTARGSASADDIAVAELATVTDDRLGDLLVDGDGTTLYVFLEDRAGSSTCTGACADTWPPLLTSGAPGAEAGVDPALVGTSRRDDGTTQVTYDGQPLYRYRGDAAPGEVRGLGIGNVWYPVAEDGAPLDVTEGLDSDDGY